ncbi:MAG: U32 family peptidase [Pseudomonadota bacterium]|nr:U32 family peptidase [Pseudomonadota bacterium]
MKTELLAPAGDIESAYSAFYFGADAVYLGLRRFSARADATNFSAEELDEITAYAHENGKKVYVTVNTLVQEKELPALMDMLTVCDTCHADAVIVQDLGVARLVSKCFPKLALHASTQMAIHNLAGAMAMKKMGFSRVVLARELTLPEIIEIRDKSGLEVEVFIHGALCYSYSGLCLFSSLNTGRSANRGKCVYSCRSNFKINGQQKHLFSMKDLALETAVLKLSGMSLKIEGRKKTPLYVGAVTDYYRRILGTGKADKGLADNLKQIFARPWTTLHFQGKNKDVIDPDFVGHRGLPIGMILKVFNHTITFKPTYPVARYDGIQIDTKTQEKPFGFSAEQLVVAGKKVFEVSAGQTVTIALPPHHPFLQKGDKVYLASSTRVKGMYAYTRPKPNAYRNRTSITVDVFVASDKIVAYCDGVSAELTDTFQSAEHPEKIADSVLKAFQKTGDTAFYLKEITLHNPEDLFVPMSVLNELRRRLYDKIKPTDLETPALPATPHLKTDKAPPCWILKTDDQELLPHLPRADEVIYELSPRDTPMDLVGVDKSNLRLALPPILRPEKHWKAVIDRFLSAGFLRWEIGNLSGLILLPKGLDISLDSTVSILNSSALEKTLSAGFSRITFSVEDTHDNIEVLAEKSSRTALILYQDVPLFLSANCVRENECQKCDKNRLEQEITNGKGRFRLISQNCQTTVTDMRPFALPPEAQRLPVGAFRIDFVNRHYTPDEAIKIVQKIRGKEAIIPSYDGNFQKQFAS